MTRRADRNKKDNTKKWGVKNDGSNRLTNRTIALIGFTCAILVLLVLNISNGNLFQGDHRQEAIDEIISKELNIFEVTVDEEYEDAIIVGYDNEEVANEVYNMLTYGEVDGVTWAELVNRFSEISKVVTDEYGDYRILLENPANGSNYVLQVSDGVATYDALEEGA